MALDGGVGVARAGRLEAAGRRQRRPDRRLIDPDERRAAAWRGPAAIGCGGPDGCTGIGRSRLRARQDRVQGARSARPRRLGAGGPGDDEHVVRWPAGASKRARQGFAQAAPDAIADHGVADAAAHRDADPRAAELIGRDVQHQQRVRPAARRRSRTRENRRACADAARASRCVTLARLTRRGDSRRRSGACARAGGGA